MAFYCIKKTDKQTYCGSKMEEHDSWPDIKTFLIYLKERKGKGLKKICPICYEEIYKIIDDILINHSQVDSKEFPIEKYIKTKMKPYFAYYGGKQRMASKIIPLIPKHTVYVEPFAGGAAVFFKKPFPNVTATSNYTEVLNDINFFIHNFFEQMKYNKDKLIELISLTPYSKLSHDKSFYILKNQGEFSRLELAWAFWYKINTSFAKNLNEGFGRSIFSRNESYSYHSKIKNLLEYQERLQTTTIECLDALECIDKWDSPQTFFYCDPPYVGTNQGHYKGYTQDDLNALIEKLDNIQGSFILSGYENSSYPAHWERFEFDSYCSASGEGKSGEGRDKSRKATSKELGNRKRKEILLRKKSNIPIRSELQKLYDKGQFDCFKG